MTTSTVTLNADGSLSIYEYGPNGQLGLEPMSAATVQSEMSMIVGWVNNNSQAGATLNAFVPVLADLAVQDGLVSGAAVQAWATNNNIQVSNIFTGTPTQGGATITESMAAAVNDPLVTTDGNVPTLVQATAQAAVNAQTGTTTTTTGPIPIAGDNHVADQVQEAYIAYYGRPADVAGLAYWVGELNQANGNLNAIINSFGNSAESTALYGGKTIAQELTAIYQQEFNRAPDASGAAYWTQQISSGAVSAAAAALAIFNGATGADQTTIDNKLVVANAFTTNNTTDTVGNSLYTGTTAAANARAYLSAVTSSATAAVKLAGIAPQVSHDIQGSITTDLASVGATATVAIQLVGVHQAIEHAAILG